MQWFFYCENSQEVLIRMKQTHLGFHFMLPQQPNTINIRLGLVYLLDSRPGFENLNLIILQLYSAIVLHPYCRQQKEVQYKRLHVFFCPLYAFVYFELFSSM